MLCVCGGPCQPADRNATEENRKIAAKQRLESRIKHLLPNQIVPNQIRAGDALCVRWALSTSRSECDRRKQKNRRETKAGEPHKAPLTQPNRAQPNQSGGCSVCAVGLVNQQIGMRPKKTEKSPRNKGWRAA